MTTEVITYNEDNESILSLPIKKEDLGSFISGLLGQQQTIERELDVYFDISHDWLINVHQLINQRIQMQAEASLVQFVAVIYLSDGLKRTLTSVEAFENYSETQKNLPIGIKLIWNYLIKFPHKDIPEKQQITFSAKIHFYGDSKDFIDDDYFFERSVIQYQIDHTERTWGDDIESLMANKIDEVVRVESKFDKIYNISRYILLIIIGIFGLNSLLTFRDKIRSEKIQDKILSYQDTFVDKLPSSDIISKKIDYLVTIFEKSQQQHGISIWVILAIVLSVISIFAFVAIYLDSTKKSLHSFLVLSQKSKAHRAKILKKESRLNIIIIGSYILSIIAGIIGNYGYNWIVNQ